MNRVELKLSSRSAIGIYTEGPQAAIGVGGTGRRIYFYSKYKKVVQVLLVTGEDRATTENVCNI